MDIRTPTLDEAKCFFIARLAIDDRYAEADPEKIVARAEALARMPIAMQAAFVEDGEHERAIALWAHIKDDQDHDCVVVDALPDAETPENSTRIWWAVMQWMHERRQMPLRCAGFNWTAPGFGMINWDA